MDLAPPSPLLVAVVGLPGAGKSSVADALGRRLGVPVVSVDPIEEGLHLAGLHPDQPLGLAAYVVAANVAGHTLGLGQRVIVDAVGAAEEARAGWRLLAGRRGATLRFVEVVCSDEDEHRRRLEGRGERYHGMAEPTWAEVDARRAGFAGWDDERLVLDTVEPLATLVDRAAAWLATAPPP